MTDPSFYLQLYKKRLEAVASNLYPSAILNMIPNPDAMKITVSKAEKKTA
jgi:hypothetical protein